MKGKRIKELKEALWFHIDGVEGLSTEDAQELLDLMNRVFPKREPVIKDPSPMIGLNPFRTEREDIVHDGDHLRIDSHDRRDKFYRLLNEENENEGGN